MADVNKKDAANPVQIVGRDENHIADVTLDSGIRKLETNASVTVTELFGQDPLPDSYFTVTAAGGIGDTVRVQIAATANDSTTPDADLPAVDVTTTVTASEVGDERALAELIVSDLEADTNFQNALFEAKVITGDKRAIVHISTTEFSNNGEFHERPNSGDFAVTTTGTTTASVAFDTIKSRGKATSLDRDPNNPHRLGILGISGQVRLRATSVDNLYFQDAENGGSNDLTVNGSSSPIVFTINANAAGQDDIIIETLKLHGTDNGIKYGKFLALNAKLTNGLLIEIQRNGFITQLPVLYSTEDLKSRYSSKGGWDLDVQAGGDHFLAIFDLVSRNLAIFLEAGTTDFVRISVRDNLTQVSELYFTAEGFEETP